MVLSTAFSQMFGIDYPIVSAPMDLIAGGELAAAVSGAGGLGLIGRLWGPGLVGPAVRSRRWSAGGLRVHHLVFGPPTAFRRT